MNEIRAHSHCANCYCNAVYSTLIWHRTQQPSLINQIKKFCVYFMMGCDRGSAADQWSIDF